MLCIDEKNDNISNFPFLRLFTKSAFVGHFCAFFACADYNFVEFDLLHIEKIAKRSRKWKKTEKNGREWKGKKGTAEENGEREAKKGERNSKKNRKR